MVVNAFFVIIFYFPSKKFFHRKTFNSVVEVSFLFVILPMTRRLCVYRSVGALYNTYVWDITADRKPQFARSNPAVGHFLNVFSETPQRILVFKYRKKNKVFSTTFVFFINGLYFSQKISVHRNT